MDIKYKQGKRLLQVWFDKEYLEKFKVECEKDGHKLSGLVRRWVKYYMDNKEANDNVGF